MHHGHEQGPTNCLAPRRTARRTSSCSHTHTSMPASFVPTSHEQGDLSQATQTHEMNQGSPDARPLCPAEKATHAQSTNFGSRIPPLLYVAFPSFLFLHFAPVGLHYFTTIESLALSGTACTSSPRFASRPWSQRKRFRSTIHTATSLPSTLPAKLRCGWLQHGGQRCFTSQS